MSDKQIIINQILSGNEPIISAGIYSDSAIVALNAILAGTRHTVKNSTFIDGIRNISTNSTDTIMGIPLRKYAIASLHILGEEQYSGDDAIIKHFIQSRFEQ